VDLVVHLEGPLAAWVEREASAQNVSPDQIVRDILVGERQRRDDSEQWQHINPRRQELIQKEFSTGLTPEEEAELETLQRAADKLLEARDRQMLAHLEQLRQAVAALPDEPEEPEGK
jgi:hypothetical protein